MIPLNKIQQNKIYTNKNKIKNIEIEINNNN